MRDQVAFIFFDLEEVGLVGSSSYAKTHKHAMKDKLLINFDCVSDGDNIMLVLGKGARAYEQVLENAYVPTDDLKVMIESKGVFYPSDQAVFKCGVGVASLKATKRGMLYMDRIHTKRDTVYLQVNFARFGNLRRISFENVGTKSSETVLKFHTPFKEDTSR
jgi:hypothetical protein